MHRSWFTCYILVLTLAYGQLYAAVRDLYGGAAEVRRVERAAETRAHALETELALEREARVEFRQNVAALMPEALRARGAGDPGYPLRSLASVVSPGQMGDATRRLGAETLFSEATSAFTKRDFVASNQKFEDLIRRFGYTSYVTKSYFLLVEGLYATNELEQCAQTIQRMIELFPADETTGYAMVRLGMIYEERKKNDLAVDTYKAVLRSFPQADVHAQAKERLRRVEL